MADKEKFALLLFLAKDPQGRDVWALKAQNQGCPPEVILFQIEAYLKAMKDKYFNNFAKGLKEEK